MEEKKSLTALESVREIAANKNSSLAWEFFVFFSRFEYALKRTGKYLFVGTDGDVSPDWKKFENDTDRDRKFRAAVPKDENLSKAVDYFKVSPPRIQIYRDDKFDWSCLPAYNPANTLLFKRLLLTVRVVRNNLFHGGKFPEPTGPVFDPSRDHDLMTNALIILNACLELDREVKGHFMEGINECKL